MENSDEARASAYTKSLLTQLEIEITAAGTSIRALAPEIGRDYNTFRRWVKGERDMPLHVLIAALTHLGVDVDTFFVRAAERLQK